MNKKMMLAFSAKIIKSIKLIIKTNIWSKNRATSIFHTPKILIFLFRSYFGFFFLHYRKIKFAETAVVNVNQRY